MKAHRWIALAGFALGAAISLLALPFFFEAHVTLKAALSELSVTGSSSYQVNRDLRIEQGILGTTAYAMLGIATIGLLGVATARIKFRCWCLSLLWLLAAAGAGGLIRFLSPRIGESTVTSFQVIYIGGPVLLIVLAAFALALLAFPRRA